MARLTDQDIKELDMSGMITTQDMNLVVLISKINELTRAVNHLLTIVNEYELKGVGKTEEK